MSPSVFETIVDISSDAAIIISNLADNKLGAPDPVNFEIYRNDVYMRGNDVYSYPELVTDKGVEFGGIDTQAGDPHNNPSVVIWPGFGLAADYYSRIILHDVSQNLNVEPGLVSIFKNFDEMATYVNLSVFVESVPGFDPIELVKDLAAMEESLYGIAININRLCAAFVDDVGDYLDMFGNMVIDHIKSNMSDSLVKKVLEPFQEALMKLSVDVMV